MITGSPFWNVRSHYFIQTNNPTEEMGRKMREEVALALSKLGVGEDIIKAAHVRSFLQSCGPEAAMGCAAALGHDITVMTPGEAYNPQPGEILMDWFHEPANYAAMRAAWNGQDPSQVIGNRWPQWYPLAIARVFGIKCAFLPAVSRGQVIEYLKAAKAVQVCLINPGHYNALVAYDDVTDEIIDNDPWPGRFENGDGFNRRLTLADWVNVQPFALVYE